MYKWIQTILPDRVERVKSYAFQFCRLEKIPACRGPPPKLKLKDWVTLQGWRERRSRILGTVRSYYAMATVRKRMGLKKAEFKANVIELFYRINVAYCNSDLTELRQVHPCPVKLSL